MKTSINVLGLIGCVALVAGTFIVGCGGGGSGATPPATTGTTGSIGTTPRSVSIPVTNGSTMFMFTSPVTVQSGASVTWRNQSSAPHSIVWDSRTPSTAAAPGANIGVFDAGTTSAPWIAPTAPPGTTVSYNYHCGIHGITMAGVINVSP